MGQNLISGALSNVARSSCGTSNIGSRLKPNILAKMLDGKVSTALFKSLVAELKLRRTAASLFSTSEISDCNCKKFWLAFNSG